VELQPNSVEIKLLSTGVLPALLPEIEAVWRIINLSPGRLFASFKTQPDVILSSFGWLV
jgi:hypothetical protein